MRKEAAKAARAAQRARRRRQDLWEQEVYGEYAAVAAATAAAAAAAANNNNNHVLQTARDRSRPSIFADDNASTSKVAHQRDQNNNNLIAAPSFQSPMFSPARCASAPPAEADPEMGSSSGGVGSVRTADPDEVGVCAQMAPSANAASLAPLAPLAPLASLAPPGGGEAAEGRRFESPTSAPSSSSLNGQGGGKDAENFAIAAYSRPVSCGGGGARGGGARGGSKVTVEY